MKNCQLAMDSLLKCTEIMHIRKQYTSRLSLYTNFSIAQYAPTGTECRSDSFVSLSSVSLQVFLWHVDLVPRSQRRLEAALTCSVLYCLVLLSYHLEKFKHMTKIPLNQLVK